MSIVPHDPAYRRIWMFPRNIRYIAPWKLSQILTLLNEQVTNSSWSGNQDIQNQFTKALELSGLKRPGSQYDSHSGGARTYLAQLVSLGLVFIRPGGYVFPTLAGEDMIKGRPPLPILQELLFRNQYPSIYSQNQNVKINPAIKVKPFLFVLEIIKSYGAISEDELIVPILYGHNHDCLSLCIEKIDFLRQGNSLESIVDDPNDLYTPRAKNRSVSNAIKDVKDISNTCKNYLKAACLIEVRKEDGVNKIYLSPEHEEEINNALLYQDKFITLSETPESYQRRLGCWNRKKDTRSLTDVRQTGVEEGIIISQFYKFAGNRPIQDYPSEFIDLMVEGFGFPKETVEQAVHPIIPKALSYFESTYLDMAKSGGKRAIEFEKATGLIFSSKMDFFVEHTGQKKRMGVVGGYGDLFLIALDEINCAIIDTKSSGSYSISASDYRAMVYSYIPSFKELSTEENTKLEFCSYVAGGYGSGIESRLADMREETGVPISAITAYDLLRVCDHEVEQSDVRGTFASGRKLTTNDFIE